MSTSLQHSPARPTLVPPPSDAQVEATVRRATQFLFEFVDRYVEGSSSGVVMKTAEAALVAGSLAEISSLLHDAPVAKRMWAACIAVLDHFLGRVDELHAELDELIAGDDDDDDDDQYGDEAADEMPPAADETPTTITTPRLSLLRRESRRASGAFFESSRRSIDSTASGGRRDSSRRLSAWDGRRASVLGGSRRRSTMLSGRSSSVLPLVAEAATAKAAVEAQLDEAREVAAAAEAEAEALRHELSALQETLTETRTRLAHSHVQYREQGDELTTARARVRALLAGDAEVRAAEARARGGADAQRCARALRAALGPEAFDRAWLKARPLLGTTLADAIDEAGGIVEKAAAEDDAVDADAPPVPGAIRAVEKRMSMALKSRSRTVWTQTMAVDRIVPLDQLDAPPAEGASSLDAALGGDDDAAPPPPLRRSVLSRGGAKSSTCAHLPRHSAASAGPRRPTLAGDISARGAGSCQRGVSRHTIGGAAASSLAPRRPIDPPPKRLTLAAVGRVSSQLAQMRSAVRAQAEGDSFKKVVPFL